MEVFEGGKCVYQIPELDDVRNYCTQRIGTIWDEVKRFENPHRYYVDLSSQLWIIRHGLIEKYSSQC